ncbi:related to Polynucleotide 3'-phosphatase [Nakaseomyces glabratus]|nr:Polynucleotide kinase 3 phosphatase [Nakaseomyces glabratus]QNG17126.1 uncharacterized protein GWK60_M09581 [Nakaseomyces glabratus]SCV13043.1 related to Polynucleotide 3'-phosphatase [Nakaseomyces glabratus]SLM10874.1 related to Polynucleotide 3'-phosphatase [Nakaseomyces glabratus]
MKTHKVTILPHLIKFIPQVNSSIADDSLNLYGFDLDHTIIQPKSGAVFARGSNDWKFMEFGGEQTLQKLIKLVLGESNAFVVVFTNQGGVVTVPTTAKSCLNFTNKIKNLLEHIEGVENGSKFLERLFIYAAPKKPASFGKKKVAGTKSGRVNKSINSMLAKTTKEKEQIDNKDIDDQVSIFTKMRKPETGMADAFISDLELIFPKEKYKYNWKLYCGDAAGRKSDFSDADKAFAETLKVPFVIPEEFF